MRKTYIIRALALIVVELIFHSTCSLYAQNTVAMPFAVKPADASSAGKAGISFTDMPLLFGRTLDISAGYMLWSPTYVPVSNVNISATYCLAGKISFSIDGMYGIGNDYGQMNIGLGAGYRMTDFLAARINLRYLSENLTPEVSYGALGADVAVDCLLPITDNGKIAAELGVFSVGSKVTSASGIKYSLPSSAKIGAGYIHDIDDRNSIKVLAEADYYFHNAIGAALGAEAKIADMISVRAGYRYGAEYVIPSFASVGVGAKFAGIKIDAAYLFANEVIGNTTAVSLGYCF